MKAYEICITNLIMDAYKLEDFLETKRSFGASFSPDANSIAFLSDLSGVAQGYVVPREGGVPKQLTSYSEPIGDLAFSPTNSADLLFAMAEGGNERFQLFLLNLDSGSIERLTNNDAAIYRFGGWSYDGKSITYSSNERNGTDFDVFVLDIVTRTSRCVFDQGGWCDAYGFSPDGTKVAILKRHTLLHNDLFFFDLNTNAIDLATPHEGHALYGQPRWLPDSSGFFFANNEGTEFLGVSFYNLTERKSDRVFDFLWDVDSLTLSNDGALLLVILNEDGYSKPRLYDAGTLTLILDINMPSGTIFDGRWSNDSQYFVFSRESDAAVASVWIWVRNEDHSRQVVTTLTKVPQEILVESTLFHYPTFDGRQIPSFIYLPTNAERKSVPAIIHLHGGPEWQARPVFNPLIQYFLHQGYAVVIPNVRGSSGYGKAYMALDDREKRMDSVRDLEYLYKAVEQRGDIDSKRIALMGGSYGGYMVLAGLAFQPDLWAAGVDIVGIANLVTFLQNTSSWRRALREPEYGYLDKDQEMLKRLSPINAIENVRAPLFIIHGANDPRVPLSEAEQMAGRLKLLGKEVELLVYFDEGHGLAKLKNRIDAYPKVVAFLDKHLMKAKTES
jgi:dipeptidyl aminopeptidase/acylaminoacyl peptidase